MDQVEINVILHVSTADGNEVDITDLEIEKPAEHFYKKGNKTGDEKMKAIQQIMDNLSEKEKYLMGLIDQLYLKPREGVPDQHFLHVRGVLCDIIECDLTDKYIYYLGNRKFIDLDDLLNFFMQDGKWKLLMTMSVPFAMMMKKMIDHNIRSLKKHYVGE